MITAPAAVANDGRLHRIEKRQSRLSVDGLLLQFSHEIESGSRLDLELNLDGLLSRMWETMDLVRVYTKKRGGKPDFEEPVILSLQRGGIKLENFCTHLHWDLAKDMLYAWVWGASSRHTPQRCGKEHVLCDEDVVQGVKKRKAAVGEAIGRFRQGPKDEPARIADRVKKAPLKT